MIFKEYEGYHENTFGRVWQGLVKAYNQTIRLLGDNDCSVKHAGVAARQAAGA